MRLLPFAYLEGKEWVKKKITASFIFTFSGGRGHEEDLEGCIFNTSVTTVTLDSLVHASIATQ